MKRTPSICVLDQCHFNLISPGENSQECVACPYLKAKGRTPKNRKGGRK